jgi:hypothetical protein
MQTETARPDRRTMPTSITCCIRYVLDPFQRDAFEAWIGFASLADDEAYRARLAADPDGADSFRFAHDRRFILSEERTFLRPVQP